MKFKPIYLLIIVIVITSFFVWQNFDNTDDNNHPGTAEALSRDTVKEVKITPNSTYGMLMEQAGIAYSDAQAILVAAEDIYDLTSIRVDRSFFLYFNPVTDDFKQLVYQIDSEDELVASSYSCETTDEEEGSTETQKCWRAEKKAIEYEVQEKTVSGEIETSLYQWALDNNIDIRAIIDLAEAYQWTIDFAIDPKVGDTFTFIYQERYRDGEYKMPGQILAAKYINSGTEYRIFYFKENEDNEGHFDQNGISVEKDLLKAPIHYSYISSGYTTGLRCLESYGLCTNHRAIDYVAAIGTPIRAVGDGTVISAGWNSGGYGNMVKIRHNDTYTTLYGHMSKILVSYGDKVKQGDIIGKVGSTGLSTGPHLHYEIIKHGTKINPLTLELPPGEPIKDENMERFFQEIERFQEILK